MNPKNYCSNQQLAPIAAAAAVGTGTRHHHRRRSHKADNCSSCGIKKNHNSNFVNQQKFVCYFTPEEQKKIIERQAQQNHFLNYSQKP